MQACFVHDVFGGDYNWTASGRLRITSYNPQQQAPALPDYAGKYDVALFNDNDKTKKRGITRILYDICFCPSSGIF